MYLVVFEQRDIYPILLKVTFVKCYSGARKIHFIPSISEILYVVIVFTISGAIYESNLTLLAPCSTQLAYLSMLFILEIADHLKKK